MKWRVWLKKNAFTVGTIFTCIAICVLLIILLNERTLVNIVTIVGTVLTVGALVFTIKEQLRLKSISKAIRDNTQIIEDKLLNQSFQLNIEHCLKNIDGIKHVRADEDLKRVNGELSSLSEHLIECKKTVKVHRSILSERCLNKLINLSDEELTGKRLKDEFNAIEDVCKEDVIKQFDTYSCLITGYITQTDIGEYQKNSISNIEEFITNINGLRNFLQELKSNQFIIN